MTEHSPEPWHEGRWGGVLDVNNDCVASLRNCSNATISYTYPMDGKNSKRIIACVNACAGIPSENLAADTWISVNDRLPDKDGLVLVHAPGADPIITTAWYDPNGEGWSLRLPTYNWIEDITHWMPLPKAPKEKSQ